MKYIVSSIMMNVVDTLVLDVGLSRYLAISSYLFDVLSIVLHLSYFISIVRVGL